MAVTLTLRDAFLTELRDLYDAENQLSKALPKLAKAATSAELRATFATLVAETKQHIKRLERVFKDAGERAQATRSAVISAIIQTAHSLVKKPFDKPARDAFLIAAAQRMEHFQIAAYGTLAMWAEALGLDSAVILLQESLEDEETANETLASLAGTTALESAPDLLDEENEEADEDEADESASTGATRAPARRKAAGRRSLGPDS